MKANNSLVRLQAVLEVFTEERMEWTPEELRDVLGYSRPTLYRYLKILKAAGLLTSMPNTGFTLGPKIVELDYLLRKSDALITEGAKHLEDLTSRYKCTALLVRAYGNKILCVDSRTSTKHAVTSYPRGRPMPLSRGAIGRSIMAFLPKRHLMRVVEEALPDMRAIGLADTVDEILDNLRRVRKAGYAVAFGELTPGVVGIASPVFDATRHPIASVCVSIAGNIVDGRQIDEVGNLIHRAGDAISSALAARRH